jgi:hypothetical protein
MRSPISRRSYSQIAIPILACGANFRRESLGQQHENNVDAFKIRKGILHWIARSVRWPEQWSMMETMSLKPFFRLLLDARLIPLLGIGVGLRTFYKLTYLAAIGESGLLNLWHPERFHSTRLLSSPVLADRAERHSRLGCRRVFVCGYCILARTVMHSAGWPRSLHARRTTPPLPWCRRLQGCTTSS